MRAGYAAGIDIGSTCAKTILLDESGELVWRDVRPTGWSSVDTAQAIFDELASLPGMEVSRDNTRFVATGYGRISVPFADRCVTEISCHAKGAVHLFASEDLDVIDIGGQDTKLIAIEKGAVIDFVMNDKCSAGTGRFLEVMANTLSVTPAGLCEMAGAGRETRISSLCTVFAESEVINLIGKGEARENIAWAVIDSIVQKVKTQASRIHTGRRMLCLTGGLCDFPYLRERLAEGFGSEIVSRADARYAGAWGAALFALQELRKH